jgi:hypothetical protein
MRLVVGVRECGAGGCICEYVVGGRFFRVDFLHRIPFYSHRKNRRKFSKLFLGDAGEREICRR